MSTIEPPFSPDDSDLIASLHALHAKQPKLVRSSVYPAPADPRTEIESWKMNEFKYYVVPSPFPTLARGLFSTKLAKKGKSREGRYRIVARGYDKFFNIGEVPWTTWESLEAQTAPPYTLTLKSNGCIIFIAALTPDKLLITSKHSTGPIKGVEESHAQVGERWLKHHLDIAGKTTEELAARLWAENWTAVAELCDDEFEEHVLPYARDKSGLHLHGLNACTRAFDTMRPAVVDAFAHEWGFIRTASLELGSVDAVRAFTEEIGRTGKWNGEAVEGFVVRTRVSSTASGARARMPYAPGSSFFFKVKFDEPYMMYRDWRELTKMLLSAKPDPTHAALPKNKLRRPETRAYVDWVREEIARNRGAFEGYTKGRGIIRTRERFLEWLETGEGKARKEVKDEGEDGGVFGKTVIVPVAIPGVGKTSVAIALAHIFGFGHTQSDDVNAKKAAPVFLQNVKKMLGTHEVVIADKNNHLRLHRQQLRDAVKAFSPPVRLLALNWALTPPLATLHRICADRILSRGANHQSLHGDAGSKAHEDVLWKFVSDAQELEEGEVDAVVEMEVGETPEEMLERAVEGCARVLGLPRPGREKIEEALDVARGYAPATRGKKAKTEGKDKPPKPRYFGLLAEVDLVAALDASFAAPDVPTEARRFWDHLKNERRIASRPHVTIVHTKSLPAESELWERCEEVVGEDVMFTFKLGKVLTNERVAAAVVEELAVDGADEGQVGRAFVEGLGRAGAVERLHVTVGTRHGSVPPVEGKELVRAWRAGRREGIEEVKLDGVVVNGRLRGLMN
ncbi:RNA ligase-domain-containing protein [Amylostereum chailletii]|nr:RNA ligase-domain-containing protein [Amylostereum chailletii]